MKITVLPILAILLAISFSPPSLFGKDVAEQLTIIESPSFGNRAQTKKRFTFLLGQFDQMCQPNQGSASTADMLVFSYKELEKIGLSDNLLAISNTLHRTVSQISPLISGRVNCSEIFAAYIVLRKSGQRPDEASNGIIQIYRALR